MVFNKTVYAFSLQVGGKKNFVQNCKSTFKKKQAVQKCIKNLFINRLYLHYSKTMFQNPCLTYKVYPTLFKVLSNVAAMKVVL